MYFNKKDVIDSRRNKQPRVSYEKATRMIKNVNYFLSLISLVIIIYSSYIVLNTINQEREAYFVTSNGEFKLIQYSKEVKKQINNLGKNFEYH